MRRHNFRRVGRPGRGLLFLMGTVLAVAAPAFAAQHFIDINEVYTNADGSVQYVELIALAPFQSVLAPTNIRAFNADGSVENVVFDFTVSYPPFGAGSAGLTLLVATPAFENAFGFAPDFVMPAGSLFSRDGRVVFFKESHCVGIPNCEIDALAYGDYTGSSGAHGSPAPFPFPTDGCMSLTRINGSNDNSLAWAVLPASPKRTDGTTVSVAPAITSQPQSQSACEGTPVTFSVEAGGAGPLSYQWRKDGIPIAGAMSDSYTVDPVTPADVGSYDVVVTNKCGSETSDSALLNLLAPEECGILFVRGECNQDGMVNIADGIFILNQLFGSPPPPRFCDDACDTNGDRMKNIADAIYLFNFLFVMGPAPPPPWPDCGLTKNPKPLGCEQFPGCL